MEGYVPKRRRRAAAPKFVKKAMKRYGQREVVVTVNRAHMASR
ncbi:hypothetical protein ACFE33_12500 [Falsihalocynthiibacter sp. SS001]